MSKLATMGNEKLIRRGFALSDGDSEADHERIMGSSNTVCKKFNICGNNGHHIGFVMDQSVQSIIILFSLARMRISVSLFETDQSMLEYMNAMDHAKITLWIVPDSLSNFHLNGYIRTYSDLLVPGNELKMNVTRGYLKLLTSGTTGIKKLVMHSYASIEQEGEIYRRTFSLSSSDKIMSTVPLNYMYGLTGPLMGALRSGALLYVSRYSSPRNIVRNVHDNKSTVLFAVPTLYQLLVNSKHVTSTSLESLRLVVSAGDILQPSVSRAFYKKFGIRISQVYGSTETGVIAYNDSPHDELEESFKILSGNAVMVHEGVIAVKSKSMFKGYLTTNGIAHPMVDGYFLTKDNGVIHGNNLKITGRSDKRLHVAGRKIDPKEIENIIKRVDGIEDVMVYGIPDPVYGEKIAALIKSDIVQSSEYIKTVISQELPVYKIPHVIDFAENVHPHSWKNNPPGKR